MFCKSLVFLSELGCIFGKKSCKNLVKVLYVDMEKIVATLSTEFLWIITKLGMWVGMTTLLNPIYGRSGWMHWRHAPLT